MKITIYRTTDHGLTRIEAVVSILVIILAISVLTATPGKSKAKAQRLSCLSNLKQLGSVRSMWFADHNNKSPYELSVRSGGMLELINNFAGAGRYAYLPFSLMQQCSNIPVKTVLCPTDDRLANTNFIFGSNNAPHSPDWNGTNELRGSFDNTNVSYFSTVTMNQDPAIIIFGDRNLGDGGAIDSKTGKVASPILDSQFGISGSVTPPFPTGADATISDGKWISAKIEIGGGKVNIGSQAVGWTSKIHTLQNNDGAGNVLMSDGSAEFVTSKSLRRYWREDSLGRIPFGTISNISTRLLFP